MPSCHIVPDSTADLDREYRESHGLIIVPLKVIFGDEVFSDGIDILPDEFFHRMETSTVVPRTSQPTPMEFEAAFRDVGQEGKPIICTTLSSELSATYNSALQARHALPEFDIRVIDTRAAGAAHNTIVRAAVDAIERDASIDEVIEVIEKVKEKQRVLFIIENLEYLRRGGRIGGARAFFGSVLNIKPLLTLKEGRVEPFDKVRTMKRALDRIEEVVTQAVEEWGEPATIVVAHGSRPEQAQEMTQRLAPLCDKTPDIIHLGPVIGCHAGPGTIGVVFYPTSLGYKK